MQGKNKVHVKRLRFAGLVVLVAVALAGCAKEAAPTYARVGDAAPAFGSKPELNDWGGFLAGTWTRGIATDANAAKQLGLESLDMDTSGDPVDVVYTFDKAGTVSLKHGRYLAEGKWTASGETVSLQFETLNGKPWQTELDRIKKEEEGGTQGAVATGLFTDNFVSGVQQFASLQLSADRKELLAAGSAMGMGNALERVSLTTSK